MKAERLAEGMEARHCALSLVGEPIMYPEINALVKLLHEKRISPFLVTNAQFLDAIRYSVQSLCIYLCASVCVCIHTLVFVCTVCMCEHVYSSYMCEYTVHAYLCTVYI